MPTELMIDDPICAEVEARGAAVRTLQDLPDAEYRGRPEWSVSQFKLLPEEPELFYGRHVAKFPDFQLEATPAMQRGTAVHAALLENRPVNVIPASVLSSSGARQGNKWKEFAAEHAGEVWMKADEAEPLQRAIDSVWGDKRARALLELPGKNELAVFWRDEYTGLPLRGRLDRFCEAGDGLVVDVKTANDPTEIGFPFACLDHKYHVQAAAYMEAIQEATGTLPEAFLFIAVQVTAPYLCRVHTCCQNMIEMGITKMREALADLKQRLDGNDWHGRGHDLCNILDLPKKAYL